MAAELIIRKAIAKDLAAIAEIYNQGIRARSSTFETLERNPEDISVWLKRPNHPVLVAEKDKQILGWVAASEYRSRTCYAGIAEFSVYIDKQAQRQGIGNALMPAFFTACTEASFWKILSRIFPENKASLALCKKHGFREVGFYEKHAQLDGVWKDVVIVEKLLESNLK